MESAKSKNLKNFIVDVDGALTTGQFHYTAAGKTVKVFGADDHDALLLLKPHLNISMISGDKRGFAITKKRVEEDMKFPLRLVSTFERVDWIKKNFRPEETVYMGDGIFDAMVFDKVGYSIAPANAFFKIKEHADYVTNARGGEGAVAEACWHILEKFFGGANILDLKLGKDESVWGKKHDSDK